MLVICMFLGEHIILLFVLKEVLILVHSNMTDIGVFKVRILLGLSMEETPFIEIPVHNYFSRLCL